MIISYQFVKFREASFVEFHRQLAQQNTITCFDFEDSVVDFRQDNTNKYKIDYREKVVKLLRKYRNKTLKSFIGFNIHKYGTEQYAEDIDALNKIEDIKCNCIFLSKCNSSEVLNGFLNETNNLRYDEVIPVIETHEAFVNLEEIAKIKHLKFKKICFGHNDYNLSCNIFPFIHQEHPMYWSWIERISEVCKRENVGFVNSSYRNLYHNNRFKNVLINVNQYFNDYGQITLNTQQSELCFKYSGKKELEYDRYDLNIYKNAKEYAEQIIHLFEKYNPEGKGYTIMPDTKVFICPQEYIAAKKIIYG